MADYREIHCPYGDDFEGGDECDRCDLYELCLESSPADVVERSKLNKAIEEINDIPVLFFEFPLGKAQVIRKDVVLDILKRNIGE